MGAYVMRERCCPPPPAWPHRANIVTPWLRHAGFAPFIHSFIVAISSAYSCSEVHNNRSECCVCKWFNLIYNLNSIWINWTVKSVMHFWLRAATFKAMRRWIFFFFLHRCFVCLCIECACTYVSLIRTLLHIRQAGQSRKCAMWRITWIAVTTQLNIG